MDQTPSVPVFEVSDNLDLWNDCYTEEHLLAALSDEQKEQVAKEKAVWIRNKTDWSLWEKHQGYWSRRQVQL